MYEAGNASRRMGWGLSHVAFWWRSAARSRGGGSPQSNGAVSCRKSTHTLTSSSHECSQNTQKPVAIPLLNEDGWLPEGVHDGTLDEAAARFGRFQESDRRPRLWARFVEFVREAQACGLIDALVVDGSFISAAPVPNDIDLILVVSAYHDFSVDFQPSAYNVLSKRRVYQRFGFDVLVARADSEEYRRYEEFFQQVRLEPGRKKGMVRIPL